jgi:chaperonin GroES
MNKFIYKPYGSRVIIRPIEQKEEKKIGNIVVPEVADHLQIGEIVGAGIGEYAANTGVLIPMECKMGDIVLFRKEAPHIPLLNGTLLMRANDLEGGVENIPD